MAGFCSIFQIVKSVLFLFNLIITGIGIIILTIGIIVQVELQQNYGDLPLDLSNVAIPVIFIGCLVVCVAFSGCWGSIMEIRWQLILYAVVTIIFAVLKIIFVAILLVKMNSTRQLIKDWVIELFQDYSFAENFYAIQAYLKCCGTTGPDSYDGRLPALPPTCCPLSQDNVTNYYDPNNYVECNKEDAFKVGCADALSDYFVDLGYTASNVVIAIIVVEVVFITMALYMVHVINQKHRRAKGAV